MVYNIFVLFSLLMLYLYYYSDYEKESCRKAIFVGMWFLFSIEFYSTKDYEVYYENFSRVHMHVIWEPLYRFLLSIFQPFGFYIFNSCVAAFEFFTLYTIFKRAVPKEYFWLAILMLILNTESLFYYMCIKRQFFAICMSLWTLYFILYSNNRLRYLWAVVTFLCAVNLHTSAYATIGYFILPLIRFRLNIVFAIIVGLLYLGSVSFQISSYSDMLYEMVSMVEDDDMGNNRYALYIDYQDKGQAEKIVSGILVQSFQIVLFILLLIYNKRVSVTQYKLFLLSIAALIFGNFLIGDFFRLNLYYSITFLFTTPILLSYIHRDMSSFFMFCLYWGFMALALLSPAKSYYNAMSGTKVSYMTIKMKHFYTIFDENPDKSSYSFEGERRIK